MADVGVLDQVTQEFLRSFQNCSHIIHDAATDLFYYLLAIELAFSSIWMLIQGETLQGFVARYLRLVLISGIFFGLIQYGGEWIPDILNGFIHVGQEAGATSLDPSSVFGQGIAIVSGMIKVFYGWGLLKHFFVGMVAAAICVIIPLIYAFIAAELVIILVKTYATISVCSLFFGFGVSEVTRPMAAEYFKKAIGLGLQLMTFYMLLGIGQNLGSDWSSMTQSAAEHHELMPMFVILAATLVYYLLLKNVPSFIASMAGTGGFQSHGVEAAALAVNTGVQAANAYATAAKGGVQTGSYVGEAIKGGYHAGVAQGGFVAGAAKGMATFAGIGAAAAGSAIKDTMMQQNKHLNLAQKLAHHASNRVEPLRAEATRIKAQRKQDKDKDKDDNK